MNIQSERKVKRKAGRPLSFDRDAALERAMVLFWEHGYEATSLAELTTAMGVTPPSVYAAFGDKKRLFLEAVDRYVMRSRWSAQLIEEAPTARDAIFGLMRQLAIDYTGETTPPGCLLTSGAISCSSAASDVRHHLADIRRGFEGTLADRIARAIAAGELPPETDALALAAHFVTVIYGMSTVARDGASRAKLLGIVDIAMNAWPDRTR